MLIKEPLLGGKKDKMAADRHRDAVNTSVHQAAFTLPMHQSDQCGRDVFKKIEHSYGVSVPVRKSCPDHTRLTELW